MVYAGSFDGTLYAIDAATGQQIFAYTTGPDALQGSPGSGIAEISPREACCRGPDSCGTFYGCLPNTSEPVSNLPSNAATGSSAGVMSEDRGTVFLKQSSKDAPHPFGFGLIDQQASPAWVNIVAEHRRTRAEGEPAPPGDRSVVQILRLKSGR